MNLLFLRFFVAARGMMEIFGFVLWKDWKQMMLQTTKLTLFIRFLMLPSTPHYIITGNTLFAEKRRGVICLQININSCKYFILL